MAYIKTTWVNDNGVPLNATNLNKIEEGIEEAHTTADTNTVSISTHTSQIEALLQTIANLSSASGSTVYLSSIPILTSETKIPFYTNTQSNDTAIFEIDGTNSEIDFKTAGSYSFTSDVTFKSSTSSAVIVTFTVRDTTTEAIVLSRDATLDIGLGNNETLSFSTVLVLDALDVPKSVKISVSASSTGIDITSFNSTIIKS